MTIEELQQKRSNLHGKIKDLAGEFKANGERWPSKDKQVEWDQVNAEYDKVAEEHDRLSAAGGVDDRLKRIEADSRRPINPLGIGFDDAEPGMVGGRPMTGGNDDLLGQGMLFRNMASGREIRALLPNQSITAAYADREEWDEDGEIRLGSIVAAMATNDHRYLNRVELNAVKTGQDDAGGYLLNPMIGSRVVDLARSASVAMAAGAQTVPMDTGELRLVKITQDPTAAWRRERTPTTFSTMYFGKVTLRPKMLSCIVPLSLEVIEDSANVGAIVEQTMRSAMGLALDQAILLGEGNEAEPRGIANTDGIKGVLGVGTPDDYTDVTAAVGQILQANYSGAISSLSWVLHPRDAETYDGLVDTTGQPLMPTSWAKDLRRFHTTSLPTDGGGGSNESKSIIGDFSRVLVGLRTSGIRLQVFDAGAVLDESGEELNALTQYARFVRAYIRADVALIQPTHMAVMSGITTP